MLRLILKNIYLKERNDLKNHLKKMMIYALGLVFLFFSTANTNTNIFTIYQGEDKEIRELIGVKLYLKFILLEYLRQFIIFLVI